MIAPGLRRTNPATAVALRQRTDLVAGASASEYDLHGADLDVSRPGELSLSPFLFRMPAVDQRGALPTSTDQLASIRFCQTMPHTDGSAMMIGCGFINSLDEIDDCDCGPWPEYRELTRMNCDVIAWEYTFVPRAIVRKTVEDSSLRTFALMASTTHSVFISYVHARNADQAVKLWRMSAYGLPPHVPHDRILALPIDSGWTDPLLSMAPLSESRDLVPLDRPTRRPAVRRQSAQTDVPIRDRPIALNDMSFAALHENWRQTYAAVEAALTMNYDFRRDAYHLLDDYMTAYRALRASATQLRDSSGSLRPDTHALMAGIANTNDGLLGQVTENKQMKRSRRSPQESRILAEIEPYWKSDQERRRARGPLGT